MHAVRRLLPVDGHENGDTTYSVGRSLKNLWELENEVDLAELDTNHEQGRKEHQDDAGVLARDGGSLASDGVKSVWNDLVCHGDVLGVEHDDEDEVLHGDEGHPESQIIDCGSHVDVCFGWPES
ncbi:hypothetical protein F5H01DRAFT_362244 [Linnemannia elongata]|nr:hypothetical protein F5H01DRAFT_362244 [Linnemannia elongata]